MAQRPGDLSTRNKSAIRLYQDAQIDFKKRNFDEGVAKLDKALRKDEQFAEAYLLRGNAYRTAQKLEEAQRDYERYIALRPDTRDAAQLSLFVGEAYLRRGQYADARPFLQRGANGAALDQAARDKARRQLESCDFAENAMANPIEVDIRPLSPTVNAGPLQYFPVLTADQQILIFTARLSNAPESDENMYVSRREGQDWSTPRSLSGRINSRGNEGTCSISADGRVLVFTRCDPRRGSGGCDLYISYRQGNEWSYPENMGSVVNSPNWDTQPALSADGRTLYFASDRPGGQGRADIWVTRRDAQGQWQPPTNLGPRLNTPGEDLGPFIHANGRTLFFSSDGHVGMGGLDLFTTERTDSNWVSPRNLGYPLNTYLDEISFFVTADGQTAYFSKEDRRDPRNSTSLLYSLDLPPELVIERAADYVRGRVFDAQTQQPLAALLELHDASTDEIVQVVRSDSVTGDYLITLATGNEYILYVNQPGYLFEGFPFDRQPAGTEAITTGVTLDVPLQPVRSGMRTTLNNIFFDSGDYRLLDESKVELNQIAAFLRANPALRVEIAGHTDDVGSATANQKLSEQRAAEVFRYLTEQSGLPPAQLRSQGYGKSEPLVPNDSDENRQKNRRIEFRVL